MQEGAASQNSKTQPSVKRTPTLRSKLVNIEGKASTAQRRALQGPRPPPRLSASSSSTSHLSGPQAGAAFPRCRLDQAIGLVPCLGIYLTGKVGRSGRTERDSPLLPPRRGRLSPPVAAPPAAFRRRGPQPFPPPSAIRSAPWACRYPGERRPKAASRCAHRAGGLRGRSGIGGAPDCPARRGAEFPWGGEQGRTQRSRYPLRPDGFCHAVPYFAARSTASPSVPATLLSGSCWGPKGDLNEILSGPIG